MKREYHPLTLAELNTRYAMLQEALDRMKFTVHTDQDWAKWEQQAEDYRDIIERAQSPVQERPLKDRVVLVVQQWAALPAAEATRESLLFNLSLIGIETEREEIDG